jgi:hypothetical protein
MGETLQAANGDYTVADGDYTICRRVAVKRT